MKQLDFAPARWIWLPSQRTLCNTFVDFRFSFVCSHTVSHAEIDLLADSRFLLFVNGRRVLWGPAPSDPRFAEADHADITSYLQPGHNAIAVRVLFYGNGEGTWVTGHPGLIACIRIHDAQGEQLYHTDRHWKCQLDRSHLPGAIRRAYHRALTECWDARLEPIGWTQADFDDSGWLAAMEIPGPADKPSLCNQYPDYLSESGVDDPSSFHIRPRAMPPMREDPMLTQQILHAGTVTWQTDPDDWFRLRIPHCFHIQQGLPVVQDDKGAHFTLPQNGAAGYLVYEFSEEIVGFPLLSLEAPAGTRVDLIYSEAHDPQQTLWLDAAFFRTSHLICRDGITEFCAFEYEALRLIQVHILGTPGAHIHIHQVGLLRRCYPYPPSRLSCSDERLQRLLDANINTLLASGQDILMDGVARERQQYGGDCGHQVDALRCLFGPQANLERYFQTYSDGLTHEGYFMDCWPTADRLVRMGQRQLGLTPWGILLDHSVGFLLDGYSHYWETGHTEMVQKVFSAGSAFVRYLQSICTPEGLLPVDGLGAPTVWLDHEAFAMQRHKQCPFQLYVIHMLRDAFLPMCRLFGTPEQAAKAMAFADRLWDAAVRNFWDDSRKLFTDNLPWIQEERAPRYSDRTLATALLGRLNPRGNNQSSVQMLIQCPTDMGISYPTNAIWRLRALTEFNRLDAVLLDFATRWDAMPSVHLNRTIQEYWTVLPDSSDEWSHCAAAPIWVAYRGLAGIRTLEPGYHRFSVAPKLCGLSHLSLSLPTVHGTIEFAAEQNGRRFLLQLTVPPDTECLLQYDGDHITLSPGRHQIVY